MLWCETATLDDKSGLSTMRLPHLDHEDDPASTADHRVPGRSQAFRKVATTPRSGVNCLRQLEGLRSALTHRAGSARSGAFAECAEGLVGQAQSQHLKDLLLDGLDHQCPGKAQCGI